MAIDGGTKPGLWALLATTPVALLFGGALLRAPSAPPTREVAPPPLAAQAPTNPSGASVPPPYCVSRFLSAFSAMAGKSTPSTAHPAVLGRIWVRPSPDGVELKSEPERPPTIDWLGLASSEARALATAFGTPAQPAAIEAVIATVPDPTESGLSYQFEVALRSLSRGVESPLGQGAFHRDRSWLPWDDRGVDASKRRDSEECRNSLPGVLLFRGEGQEDPRLFVLLLVGESPTSGLRQWPMLQALSLQAKMDSAPRGTAQTPRLVRIVGPTYSGSAQSLRRALQAHANADAEPLELSLISGVATGAKVPEWLGTRRKPVRLPNNSLSRFSATIVPEAMAECAYFGFLRHRLGVTETRGASEEGGPSALAGVATLSESGTEFGATISRAAEGGNLPCPWKASASFHFPFHVSALRDAYETVAQRDVQARRDAALARSTVLDASLHEGRNSLEPEANLSDKTRAAEDVTLNNLIAHLGLRQVSHVAIHATDVGDAIFLARKIRDSAPDVRLAFFDADALLMHSDFRREVLGSLVVTPYPFLGLSDFDQSPGKTPSFDGFESGLAEGTYNAVLAQRAAPPRQLSEYLLGSRHPLPVWVAAIGRGTLLPARLTSTPDCGEVLYGSVLPPNALALCGSRSAMAVAAPRREFIQAAAQPLGLDSRLSRPRAWDFLFIVLCFGLWLDKRHQDAAALRFSDDPFPEAFEPANDQQLDRAIARTKWGLYAAIRSFLFALTLSYMGLVYLLGLVAQGGSLLGGASAAAAEHPVFCGLLLGAALVSVSGSFWLTGRAVWRFAGNYLRFARCVGATLLPWRWRDLEAAFDPTATDGPTPTQLPAPDPDDAPPSNGGLPAHRLPTPTPPRGFRRSVLLCFGVLSPRERQDVARISFAQLRLLTGVTLVLVGIFVGILLVDTAAVMELPAPWRVWEWSTWRNEATLQRLTLYVQRTFQLTSGVSPSAPSLLCMVCVYVWAAGRMARLSLAHSISRASPADGETDLVSTPIRLILYPRYAAVSSATDAGFTEVERDVLNAIWRPLTGRYYVVAAITLAFFPVVLFTLKTFSTLEGASGTAFLGFGLALCTSLVGVTLVQLVQYWFALERLLKRTLEHPLGSAFADIPAFARDSVEDQISRSPDEILRWSACARQFEDLERSSGAVASSAIGGHTHPLSRLSRELRDRRAAALSGEKASSFRSILMESEPPVVASTASKPAVDVRRAGLEAALARQVVRAASVITKLLEEVWAAKAREPEVEQERPARISGQVELSFLQSTGTGTLALASDFKPWGPGSGRGMETQAVASLSASSTPPPASSSAPKRSEPSIPASRDAISPVVENYSAADVAWLRSAQVFSATVVTLLIHRHLRQFRYFLQVTTGCALLLLLALTSYAFEPYRLLLTFIWVVMLSVVVTGLGIFVSIDRNTLVSHIAGSPPDRLTWNGALLVRVVGWVVMPLLGVAAAQYPQLANLLGELVGPFARALR